MTLQKETVLVSYPPSLHESAWLRTKILESIAPKCEHSILLLDAPRIHPALKEAWSGKGRHIVQHLKNGQRITNGCLAAENWSTVPFPELKNSDRNELHAFALSLAMVSAARSGFCVRSFILRGPERDEGHVSHVLENVKDCLHGEVTIFTSQPTSSSDDDIIVWLDTETTSRYAPTGAVIEIAATISDATGEKVLAEFEGRAAPPRWAKVDPEALRINRYDSDPRWNDKIDHESLIKNFSSWLPKRFRLGGHYVPFDRTFMNASFGRYGLPDVDWHDASRLIDTCAMTDRLLKRTGKTHTKKLEDACAYFGLKTGQMHGARADIDATRMLYLKLVELEKTSVRGQGRP